MTETVAKNEILQRLLTDALPMEEERTIVERLIQREPATALSLLPLYVQHRHRLKAELDGLREALRQLPWQAATVIRRLDHGGDHVLVATGNRRLAVSVWPPVDGRALRCGTQVFLSQDMKVLVAVADDVPRAGAVGTFSRLEGESAVLRSTLDGELVLDVADEVVAAGLTEGDLLVFDRESLVATKRLERREEAGAVFEAIPELTFESIGGLDECLEEIKDEVTLHALHRDLVARHRLKPSKGIVLCGPPGCGKTMIARALANYLARQEGVEAKFLNVKPGAHRSMWYGQTEARIGELFAAARRAAQGDGSFVVMLFDDVDHLGARGDSVSTAIDSRVLPRFLSEIDGLPDRVWLVAATNRPDLLDEALLRPGRFGDKVFRIPRPGRQAAREIFRKYLVPDLPYLSSNGDDPLEVVDEMIEAALAMLYAPNGEGFTLGTLVFRDGTRSALTAPQVMSGALIAGSVADAKRLSCLRAIRAQRPGLATADLLAALDRQLRGITERLRPGPTLRQTLDLPEDLDVVKVEVDERRELPRHHEYVRIH